MKELKMKALVFVGRGEIKLIDKPIPIPGLTIGHEPVGEIVALGSAVFGYHIGQQVIAGAISPCVQEERKE